MMKIPTAGNALRAMDRPCGFDWNFGASEFTDGGIVDLWLIGILFPLSRE